MNDSCLFFFIVIVLVIIFFSMRPSLIRSQIRRAAKEKGWTNIEIYVVAGPQEIKRRGMMKMDGYYVHTPKMYMVKYQDEKGQPRRIGCEAGLFSDVIWGHGWDDKKPE